MSDEQAAVCAADPVTRLADVLRDRWMLAFAEDPELLGCELDSTCGQRIFALCTVADTLLALVRADPDAADVIAEAVAEEARCVYFG